jgi:hypothetical protein
MNIFKRMSSTLAEAGPTLRMTLFMVGYLHLQLLSQILLNHASYLGNEVVGFRV